MLKHLPYSSDGSSLKVFCTLQCMKIAHAKYKMTKVMNKELLRRKMCSCRQFLTKSSKAETFAFMRANANATSSLKLSSTGFQSTETFKNGDYTLYLSGIARDLHLSLFLMSFR